MSWLRAFGWWPVPVFYLPWLFGKGGIAWGLVFVVIRSDLRNDSGVHLHELEHVEQAYRGWLLIHALRYVFSRSYRARAEAAAYHVQVCTYPTHQQEAVTRWAADRMVADYGLAIDHGQAMKLIAASGGSHANEGGNGELGNY